MEHKNFDYINIKMVMIATDVSTSDHLIWSYLFFYELSFGELRHSTYCLYFIVQSCIYLHVSVIF